MWFGIGLLFVEQKMYSMKTIISNLFFITLLASILCSQSCGIYYYAPTKQSVLQFKDKGDVSVTAGSSIVEEVGFGVDFTMGYAFTEHLAFNSMYQILPNSQDDYIWDNEVIYFNEVEKNLFFSSNLGFGFGELLSGNDYLNIIVFREYLQPSFGFSNDFFDIAISGRFSNVHYNVKETSKFKNVYNYHIAKESYSLGDLGRESFNFFEPSFTLGVGYKGLKLRYQIGIAAQLDSSNIEYYKESFSFLSLNASFNIVDLFRNKRKSSSHVPGQFYERVPNHQ
jgi:hypothetical protein